MRFNHKPAPHCGDERAKTRFLLFPKRLGMQTRWLERTTWIQEYSRWATEGGVFYCWDDVKWADEVS